ncbi:unnamed protein product [Lactuca virosa]|uniref:Uncharacterized protein n=1 Tax=Lactuca virosa TaxID=75947 RepID=A0AAU9LD95_9ASTR|nr:unnamed protein product [Lactuca virosa]
MENIIFSVHVLVIVPGLSVFDVYLFSFCFLHDTSTTSQIESPLFFYPLLPPPPTIGLVIEASGLHTCNRSNRYSQIPLQTDDRWYAEIDESISRLLNHKIDTCLPVPEVSVRQMVHRRHFFAVVSGWL